MRAAWELEPRWWFCVLRAWVPDVRPASCVSTSALTLLLLYLVTVVVHRKRKTSAAGCRKLDPQAALETSGDRSQLWPRFSRAPVSGACCLQVGVRPLRWLHIHSFLFQDLHLGVCGGSASPWGLGSLLHLISRCCGSPTVCQPTSSSSKATCLLTAFNTFSWPLGICVFTVTR